MLWCYDHHNTHQKSFEIHSQHTFFKKKNLNRILCNINSINLCAAVSLCVFRRSVKSEKLTYQKTRVQQEGRHADCLRVLKKHIFLSPCGVREPPPLQPDSPAGAPGVLSSAARRMRKGAVPCGARGILRGEGGRGGGGRAAGGGRADWWFSLKCFSSAVSPIYNLQSACECHIKSWGIPSFGQYNFFFFLCGDKADLHCSYE